MTLPNTSPVAGADVEAAPVRANLENLDTRLASVETQIADLAVSMDTYANGVFYGGLVASIMGTYLIYSPGGLSCSHTYYYKSTETQDFSGLSAATYYVECTSAGLIDIYPSSSSDRTNINTVVWNGSGFDSVTTVDRVVLYGDDSFVALPGRAGGQTIYGGTGASEDLVLEPTYHATKGYIVIGTGVAGIDYAIKFNGETNDGILTWKEDEDYFEFSDGILLATAEQIYFRDTNISIASVDDGHLDIAADVSVDINSPLLGFLTDTGIQFRDSAITIKSLDDGHLDLTSDVSIDLNSPIAYTKDIQPVTDDTYYLGKNSISTPKAYKGIILKDTIDGFYYRIETLSGIVTATKLT